MDSSKNKTKTSGQILIISAPSGTGKTTLCREILNRFPDIRYSVSFTTRSPRPGEAEGIDYHFIDRHEFQQRLSDNLWAEWAEVHGQFYGTSAEILEDALMDGGDVLLDVDVQGAIQLMEKYPESKSIFIMPPSMEALKERLEIRGKDSPDEIEKRLYNAEKEISQKGRYHHVVINDQLSDTIAELESIVQKYCSND